MLFQTPAVSPMKFQKGKSKILYNTFLFCIALRTFCVCDPHLHALQLFTRLITLGCPLFNGDVGFAQFGDKDVAVLCRPLRVPKECSIRRRKAGRCCEEWYVGGWLSLSVYSRDTARLIGRKLAGRANVIRPEHVRELDCFKRGHRAWGWGGENGRSGDARQRETTARSITQTPFT